MVTSQNVFVSVTVGLMVSKLRHAKSRTGLSRACHTAVLHIACMVTITSVHAGQQC